jgi:hypothetical protein
VALYFLCRLDRLMALRRRQSRQLNQAGFVLLDHAIYSTYCDVVDLGYPLLAKQLLHPAQGRSQKVR